MVYYGPTKLGLSTGGIVSSASSDVEYPNESDVRYGIEFDFGRRIGTYLVTIPTPIVATNIIGIQHNFQIDQYANFSATVTIKDTYYLPIDLNNYTISSSLKENEDTSDFVSFTVTESDFSNGIAILSLNSDQTGQLTPGSYFYDVIITNNTTDNTMRVLFGHARVSTGVTH